LSQINLTEALAAIKAHLNLLGRSTTNERRGMEGIVAIKIDFLKLQKYLIRL